MTGEANLPDPAVLADDALARWRWLIARREAVIGAIRARTGDRGDYWAARTATIGRALRAGAGPNPALDFVRATIAPEETILDVGAGQGRFAIPLAAVAREVVAVEPHPAMLAPLREEVAVAGLTTLRIVEAGWEEAIVPPADVVLCANVLMPIADAGPFLRKLDAHARRRCYVVLRTTPMDAPLAGLWAAVHGAPYPRETGPADAYAALEALGIAAQVAILPSPASPWEFESPETAARLVRERLWLGAEGHDPRADALVAGFLTATLAHDDQGWHLPAPPQRIAVLWWSNEG